MKYKKGDTIWFIKSYYPKFPKKPFMTYKIHKGVIKKVISNAKIIGSDGELLYSKTVYKLKGFPNCEYSESSIFATEEDAKLYFKEKKLKEHF